MMFLNVWFPFPMIFRVSSNIEILTNVTDVPKRSLVANDNLRSAGILDGTTSQTCRVPPYFANVYAAIVVVPTANTYVH